MGRNAANTLRSLGAAAAALAAGGCVERKMMIRSEPSGAVITLDGTRLESRTPAEVPLDFGGTRGVTLAAPGHKLLEATAHVEDPWFTYFPLDLFAEFLWPGTIEDVQEFHFTLEPYGAAAPADEDALRAKIGELKRRAESYRAGGSEGPREPEPAPAGEPAK